MPGALPNVRRVLITGFEPFGKWRDNSSWRAAERYWRDSTLARRRQTTILKLPVAHGPAATMLDAVLQSERPDAVLCLGLAPSTVLRLELGARVPSPSAARWSPGPFRRHSAWPITETSAALRADGHPTRLSRNAGRYVCETTLRAALDRRALSGRPRLALFLHLPPPSAAWPDARLARVVSIAVGVVA